MVGALLVIGLCVVAARLVQLQVIDGAKYEELARRQYESKVVLQAERGAVFDRNGNLLATNAISYSFAIDPKHVEHPQVLATAFAEALGESYDGYLKRISMKDRSFVWIKRKVSGAALEKLRNLDDDGLIKIKEPLRHFEYDSLGAQVIGCTDIDNSGLSGIELFYNEELRGREGYMVMQRDALGHRRPDVDLPQLKPEHGKGLVLTIDVNVQGIVEEELKRGVETAGAVSGTAIALEPRTGEVLAIASYPSYNPNDVRSANPSTVRVRAITDMYEPGSTMKAFTAAAAIEEEVIDTTETIDGEGGIYQFSNHTIRDDHPQREMTFRQAFEESSNIAFAKIASRLPEPRFYKYVRDFGFGIISGIDLPGEVRGDVKKPKEFTEGTQQFMAFGYQLAVTPLQLACAYAAIANGGLMMKPHLLKRRLDVDGHVIDEVAPQEIRRVITEETAASLRDLLVGVVENGTGRAARIPGLAIAGKTGTAQQISDGLYSKSKYNASFVGFFPADDPKVTLLVLLDSPTNGYYGGQVAAPIFREIARRIINASMHGTETDLPHASLDTGRSAIPVQPAAFGGTMHLPDLRGLQLAGAKAIAEKHGFRVVSHGGGGIVMEQEPRPGAAAELRSVLTLGTAARQEPVGRMPELRGMSLRRAINVLSTNHIRPRFTGSGVVRWQSPPPGAPLRGGETAEIRGE